MPLVVRHQNTTLTRSVGTEGAAVQTTQRIETSASKQRVLLNSPETSRCLNRRFVTLDKVHGVLQGQTRIENSNTRRDVA